MFLDPPISIWHKRLGHMELVIMIALQRPSKKRQEPFIKDDIAAAEADEIIMLQQDARARTFARESHEEEAARHSEPALRVISADIAKAADTIATAIKDAAYEASSQTENQMEILRRIQGSVGLCLLGLLLIFLKLCKVF